jgi:DNA-binding MarR family transcriptional regulator
MAKKNTNEEIIGLLQHLLVIELWRGGLSQTEIRARLGLSTTTVNAMLKGVSKGITTQVISKS